MNVLKYSKFFSQIIIVIDNYVDYITSTCTPEYRSRQKYDVETTNIYFLLSLILRLSSTRPNHRMYQTNSLNFVETKLRFSLCNQFVFMSQPLTSRKQDGLVKGRIHVKNFFSKSLLKTPRRQLRTEKTDFASKKFSFYEPGKVTRKMCAVQQLRPFSIL